MPEPKGGHLGIRVPAPGSAVLVHLRPQLRLLSLDPSIDLVGSVPGRDCLQCPLRSQQVRGVS